MNVLLYTTVGFNEKYLDLLNLYCDSLCYSNRKANNLLVICDESFQSRVVDILSKYAFLKWYIHPVEDSPTPVVASMHKLHLFDFKDIYRFSIALYVDVDCLFTDSYEIFLNNSILDGKLYVYEEGINFNCEVYGLWSIKDGKKISWFNDKHMERLEKLGKKPFNAGLFMFRISPLMESHFRGLNKFIEHYTDEYFYEQSFMNTWFSLNDFTDTSIFRRDNVAMMHVDNQFKDYNTIKHAILHFNMTAAMGQLKYDVMTKYIELLKNQNNNQPIFPNRELMVSVLIPEYAKIIQLGNVGDGTFADTLVSRNPSKLTLIDEWDTDPLAPARVLKRFQFNPNVTVFQGDVATYFKTMKPASMDVIILSKENSTAEMIEKAYNCLRTYGLIICESNHCEKFIGKAGSTYILQSNTNHTFNRH